MAVAAMKICPTCGELYSDDTGHCAADGQALSGNVPTKEWAVPLGSVLGGYRLVNRLGKGGMGVVNRGEHQRLGKRVAIKMLRPDLAAEQTLVQRFFDEARAATRIGHDGIVQIFDFEIGREMSTYFKDLSAGFAILRAAGIPQDKVFEGRKEPTPVQAYKALSGWLGRAQRAGRIGAFDIDALTATILGAMHSWASTTEMCGRRPKRGADERFVEQFFCKSTPRGEP
jgi:hypothetical protein